MADTDDQVFAAWTQGRRERQEDNCGMAALDRDAQAPNLLVVADGMGGQAAGNVASDAAVSEFIRSARGAADNAPGDRLRLALNQANAELAKRVAADSRLKGMGTTLAAAEVRDGRVRWISVGDSPMLLVRGDAIRRINQDHSLAGLYEEQVARGELSRQDAQRRGGRNELRSALMGDPPPTLIDLQGADNGLALEPGDILILATDGVLTLSLQKIKSVALRARRSARAIAQALVRAVDEAKAEHQDNATVLVYVHPGRARSPETFPAMTLIAAVAGVAVIAIAVFAWMFLTEPKNGAAPAPPPAAQDGAD
ncbi:MAG: SpoIIE family protein phosphatase [Alphaproteobacteria bacterium]|nr:SpoIIE family protein phosphatase [Alphaproteobacteria bacterium]